MSWRDAITLAIKTVRRRPGRALLTVLAVALAAALLTALLTISTTAETRVLDQLSSGGPLAGIKVAAAEPDPGQVDRDDAQPGDPKDLDQATVDQIAALPDVREVIPIISTRMYAITPARDKDGHRVRPFAEDVVGVDLSRINQLPVTLTAGRLPTEGSLSEVAVTQGYLERLGLERLDAPQVVGTELAMAAGQIVVDGSDNRVRGRWTKYTIVGVVAQEAGGGQFLASQEVVQQARAWAAAGSDASQALELPSSPYTGLFVVARGIDNVSKVRAQITAIGYSTAAPENLLASVRRYLRVVEIVLSAVGLIALVVAALGISNAMLAAVRERRREIGVMKAIGAHDRDVYRVFLVEAATLGFFGGVIGTALGWVIAAIVARVVNGYLAQQRLVGVQLSLPWTVGLGAIAGSTLLALLAGTLPAVRAPPAFHRGRPSVAREHRRLGRMVRALAFVAAALVAATACSSASDTGSAAAPPVADSAPPTVFVAMGGVETLNSDRNDLPDNWPQLVFSDHLPVGAVYVNLGSESATAASVLTEQVPDAADLHPTIVAIWVEAADVRQGTPADRYRQQLTSVVEGVRALGATQILLLTPGREPPDGPGGYADQVAAAATATGATLVDLGDVSDRSDDSGQRRIADAVIGALGS